MNDLRWKKYPVLNDGFICLVDHMGDDSRIVQAARVSYGMDEREDELLDKYFLEGARQVFGDDADDVSVSGGTMTVFMTEQGGYQEVLFEGPIECGKAQAVIDYCHKKTSEQLTKNRGLIRRLMMDGHTSPFEKVKFEFLVRVPMDCWRQWIRHRTADVNEYSTRYKEAIDSQQTTHPGEWRLQSQNNKQGSSGFLYSDIGDLISPEQASDLIQFVSYMEYNSYTQAQDILTQEEDSFHKSARKLYDLRLALGIAREQARKDLPLSTYTEAYWGCNLHNIFNFLRLRMDSHAQLEIRSYANAMYEIIKQVCPIACEAFEDYVLHAKKFSRMEMEVLKGCVDSNIIKDIGKHTGMTDNEWKSFLEKLQ
jgi:flavin-dependent thymidylate synthase